MAFHNVLLPQEVQYGSISGPAFATIVQETASGHEIRVQREAQGRHTFRPVKQLLTTDEAHALKAFALGRRGALDSFRLRDWFDSTTATDGVAAPTALDEPLGTGDGVRQQFQLRKVYDRTGPSPYNRALTLPVDGSVLVALDGIATSGFTVATGGLVTITPAPAAGVIVSAGCRFDVPVRFTKRFEEWVAINAEDSRIWNVEQIECIEVLDEVLLPETWSPGGLRNHGARLRETRS